MHRYKLFEQDYSEIQISKKNAKIYLLKPKNTKSCFFILLVFLGFLPSAGIGSG